MRQLSILLLIGALLVHGGIANAQKKQKQDNQEDGKPSKVRPQLLRGPYLQSATSNSIVIRWRTDASARSRVRYGADPGHLASTADDSALVTEHQLLLAHLQPSTRYYYSIGAFRDTLQAGRDNSFTTMPLPGTPGDYRIGIFGDCGNNSVNQRNVRDQFLKYVDSLPLTAWILVGDNAYSDGTDAEFQTNFFNIYKDNLLKKYPLYPAPGNHDYHDIEFTAAVAQRTHSVAYYQDFSVPEKGEAGGVPSHTKAFYSYDIGNVHFLSLDSYGKEAGSYRLYDTAGPQVQWIKQDLEANTNRDWVIAYWHHPPYTMGSHSSDKEDELVRIRENFIRILERYGVDVIICGHSHDYERSRLMKGYYGKEADFDPVKYDLSPSSGKDDGSPHSEPYRKDLKGGPGTVYVVTGSAGKLGGQQPGYPHDAMYFSDATHGGASLLHIRGNRLEFSWICADGVVRDHFVMEKKP
jgi:hypothetical protein